MPARVGVDSYAYHRLLGRSDTGRRRRRISSPRLARRVAAARRLELDFALLQTSFLGEPSEFSTPPSSARRTASRWACRGAAPRPRVRRARRCAPWPRRLARPAARLGLPVMRVVAGGPAHRGRHAGRLAGLLGEACAAARDHGLGLHSRITATSRQTSSSGSSSRSATSASASTRPTLRVGDDVAAAARRLAPAVEIVHLKDCEASWDDPASGPASVLGEGVIPVDEVLDACPDALAYRARAAPGRRRRGRPGRRLRLLPPRTMSPSGLFDLRDARARHGRRRRHRPGDRRRARGSRATVAILSRSRCGRGSRPRRRHGHPRRRVRPARPPTGLRGRRRGARRLDVLVPSHGTLHAAWRSRRPSTTGTTRSR